MTHLYPRNPDNYGPDDGVCSERQLRYRIWHQGKPRKIGDLSVDELRGALLDAQNDLNLVCLKLYRAEVQRENVNLQRAVDRMGESVDDALRVAKRHRVFSEEDEALDAEEAASQQDSTPLTVDGPP